MPNPKQTLRLFDWTNNQSASFHKKLGPASKNCKKKIKAVFCYGDCVTLNDDNSELLATPAPLGSDQLEICADQLLERLGPRKLAPSILQHYCETYLLSEMKRENVTGLSCASSRLDVDCSQLLP